MSLVLLVLACGLAFANGANDNCKGVAALAVVHLLARPVTTLTRRASGGCACVVEAPKLATAGGGLALERSRQGLAVGHLETCTRRSAVVLMDGDRLMRAANWLASGLVGFTRAWNDTPKIAAACASASCERSSWHGSSLCPPARSWRSWR